VCTSDAKRVADAIADTVLFYGAADPLCAEQLNNKAANAACLADGQNWADPTAVSRAFTIAAAALGP